MIQIDCLSDSLTYIPATVKRLDFVQKGVNTEMPPYTQNS